MRILQVRFKNLNSVVGEWEIDLTHPAFASDGIFAITGPTGAGKTTILDAICLALYGRTPRLNKVTKGGNEIMSRQTGECFAEVIFETQTGRFCCHWSQHRAHRKPDGELQAPKHEIANANTGGIFESRIKGVADRIEEATGMDFDRFTRSMLLAQGGFDTFLRAEADKRAPILEQITGTEIYSRISIRVHERQREEREKLGLLQAETTAIVILEADQEKEIKQALEEKQKEEAELAAKSADTAKAIAWLAGIDGLKKEISSLAKESDRLQSDIDAFRPDREKLSRALSAATMDGAYATLIESRKQKVDDQTALKAEEEALPALESSARKQAEALKAAEQQTARVEEELKAAAPLLRRVRSLDQRLAELKKAVSEGEENFQKEGKKIDEDKKARLKQQKKRTEAKRDLGFADDYLKGHAQDEWLISGLAGVEEQLEVLRSRQREIIQKKAHYSEADLALKKAIKKLEKRTRQCVIQKKELEDSAKRLEQLRDELGQMLEGRLLREYRTEKETLLREMAFFSKIAELEDHRARLEDGQPCPLCGAKEHPFARGNVPVPDETERKIEGLTKLIIKAEDQEAAIRKLEEAESLVLKKLTESERQETEAANDKKAAAKALVQLTEGLGKLHADFNEMKKAVSAKLQPLGITEIPDTDISLLLESLKVRLNAWQVQVRKKNEIEKQIADIDSELKRLNAVIDTQSTSLAERQERLKALKKELETASDKRNALYGDKDPDDEERRLNKAVSDAESIEKQVRDLYHELLQKWNTAKDRVESLKRRIDQREERLQTLETEFSAALGPVGFLNEEQFLESRLTAAQRDELSAKAKELEESRTDLRARQKDRETRLSRETARNITKKSPEELEVQFKEYEGALKGLRDIIAGFRHKLKENKAARERIRAKHTAIEAQKKECRRWENLHELIGSADGKKYRNFAQGLTFEIMIGHANRQLQKMSDRYLLVRDDAQPLELNVVDNYQAGEIRSTKNLSGGESFIVSLALALGLSHMSSQNVRVDSLFLDEGFGTLDDEALDTALEALAGLQQDEKLIGIISHVSALQERISTRIQVTPQTGGRSRISGPGCSRI